jgi:arylsulfotransferase ASST
MLTRAQFLRLTGGGIAGALASANATDAAASLVRRRGREALAREARVPPFMSFHSRRDLRPPALRIHPAAGVSPSSGEGYLFLAPTSARGAQAGALIIDATGQPVWFHPVKPGQWVSNFRVQQYRGEPVLTLWEGIVRPPGYGRGEGVILDTSYREVARIRAARGRQADLHEFRLTPQGTALITCHPPTVAADLSGVGGSSQGLALESIIQEIDVATGKLLFEWRSLEHVGIDESLLPPAGIYDYLHVNSIDPLPDGDLLVSGRHTCTLYKLDRHSGRVVWRLGGRRSDFALGAGASFHWQHDARHLPGDRISVFDNGAGPVRSEPQSRGVVLHVDQHGRTAGLVRSYRHPRPILTSAMGNVQTLPDANVMIAWGLVPVLSEFARDGRLIGEVHLPWGYNLYRGFRMPWTATPTDKPVIAARRGSSSRTGTIYASWNGATTVSSWQLSVGPSPHELQPAGVTPRTGFETAIALSGARGYAAVTALDANGTALSTSAPIAL